MSTRSTRRPSSPRKKAGRRRSTGRLASSPQSSSAESTSQRRSPPRYGRAASKKVQRSMHEMKEGTLRSAGSGKRVTNPKQAVAIGLSEARRSGAKVPSPIGGARGTRSRRTSGARARARAARARGS